MTQPNSSANNQSEINEVEQRLQQNLGHIKNKIMVMSGKGGVGKSTVAAYLALGLAALGHEVGLMDVDLHGPSVPRMLGLKGQHALVQEEERLIMPVSLQKNLKVISVESLMPDQDASVIWRGPLKVSVIKQFLGDVHWDHLDYLIIDSPPGTGDEPLTVAQTIPGAKALVVTTPQEIALADVRKSLDFCRQIKLPVLGLVENMSGVICPHCGEEIALYGSGGGENLAAANGLEFLAKLPVDSRLILASDLGHPLEIMKESKGAAPGFQELVKKVEKLASSDA
jgi:Mrp family chromosome partitioning ATPase